jgi:cation diffusion facilitator family transporter
MSVDKHYQTLAHLQHGHNFVALSRKGERRTRQVLVLTVLMMIAEIAAGFSYESMALLADGWHMATHAAAFLITLMAYRYSRLHADDQTFAFSPAKVGVLGGFASSIALGAVALMMAIEAIERFWHPHRIQFNEALIVAGVGFMINLVCALLLKDSHYSHPYHHPDHSHPEQAPKRVRKSKQDSAKAHGAHDHNLKAAYAHVLADALTSVLAILALLAGKYYGQTELDPLTALIGAALIMRWAFLLIRETAPLLLDESIDQAYLTAFIELIENDGDVKVTDLHVWPIANGHFAMILSIVADAPQAPEYYKNRIKQFHNNTGRSELAHITVEVNPCRDRNCAGPVQGSKINKAQFGRLT